MKRILTLLGLGLFCGPLAAADRPVLIELFASENCTACPKAHKTLKAVSAEHSGDLLVLTWSVDYWDYLGDPDPMALPAASERQSVYAERFEIRAPYTPQSIYDGAVECPATRKKAVEANISARTHADSSAQVKIDSLEDGFSLDGYANSPADVLLVEYLSGEANETDMVNPVVTAQTLGTWTGGHVTYKAACRSSCAVIVQEKDQGEVYAARQIH